MWIDVHHVICLSGDVFDQWQSDDGPNIKSPDNQIQNYRTLKPIKMYTYHNGLMAAHGYTPSALCQLNNESGLK